MDDIRVGRDHLLEGVDLGLQPINLRLGHAEGLVIRLIITSDVPPAEIGAEVEEIILDPRLSVVHLALAMQTRKDERGVGLIDRAIG